MKILSIILSLLFFCQFSTLGLPGLSDKDINETKVFQQALDRLDPEALTADPIFVMGLDRGDYQKMQDQVGTDVHSLGTSPGFGYQYLESKDDSTKRVLWYLPAFYDAPKEDIPQSLKNDFCALLILKKCLVHLRELEEEAEEEAQNSGVSFLLVSNAAHFHVIGGRLHADLLDLFSGHFIGGFNSSGKMDLDSRTFLMEGLRSTKIYVFKPSEQAGDVVLKKQVLNTVHKKLAIDESVFGEDALWVETREDAEGFKKWLEQGQSRYKNAIHISHILEVDDFILQAFLKKIGMQLEGAPVDLFGFFIPDIREKYQQALLAKARNAFEVAISHLSEEEVQKFKRETFMQPMPQQASDPYGYKYFCAYDQGLQKMATELKLKLAEGCKKLKAALTQEHQDFEKMFHVALDVDWLALLGFAAEDEDEAQDLFQEQANNRKNYLWKWQTGLFKEAPGNFEAMESYFKELMVAIPVLSGNQKLQLYQYTTGKIWPDFKKSVEYDLQKLCQQTEEEVTKRIEAETALSMQLSAQRSELEKIQQRVQQVVQHATRIDFYNQIIGRGRAKTLRYATLSSSNSRPDGRKAYLKFPFNEFNGHSINKLRPPRDELLSSRPSRHNNPEYFFNIFVTDDTPLAKFYICFLAKGKASGKPNIGGLRNYYTHTTSCKYDAQLFFEDMPSPFNYKNHGSPSDSAWHFLTLSHNFHYDTEQKTLKKVILLNDYSARSGYPDFLLRQHFGGISTDSSLSQILTTSYSSGSTMMDNFLIDIQWEQEVSGYVAD